MTRIGGGASVEVPRVGRAEIGKGGEIAIEKIICEGR